MIERNIVTLENLESLGYDTIEAKFLLYTFQTDIKQGYILSHKNKSGYVNGVVVVDKRGSVPCICSIMTSLPAVGRYLIQSVIQIESTTEAASIQLSVKHLNIVLYTWMTHTGWSTKFIDSSRIRLEYNISGAFL